jgi:hypothetical protein
MLDRWIIEKGYTLAHVERSHFQKGPFRWSSRGQVIFRIKVLDKAQISRNGWVRCGSRFKGAAFSDDIEGILDENPAHRD